MIAVRVNGESWLLPEATMLADVVARLTDEPRGLAVALDGAVVPRPRWSGTPVRGGATIEVLTAVQGG